MKTEFQNSIRRLSFLCRLTDIKNFLDKSRHVEGIQMLLRDLFKAHQKPLFDQQILSISLICHYRF